MTAMLIMGKYFSYLTARAVSRAVMQVEKILSHLSGGKESTFLTPQTGGESDFPASSQPMNKNALKRGHAIPMQTSIPT